MELIAFVGNDDENWGQISALIKRMKWNKIVLVRNKNAEGFPEFAQTETIKVNSDRPILDLKSELMDKLKEKISGEFEVALSLASGNGKEHMALISALLSIPVGIRLVVFTKEGVEFIN